MASVNTICTIAVQSAKQAYTAKKLAGGGTCSWKLEVLQSLILRKTPSSIAAKIDREIFIAVYLYSPYKTYVHPNATVKGHFES